jgi:hypothetical protein
MRSRLSIARLVPATLPLIAAAAFACSPGDTPPPSDAPDAPVTQELVTREFVEFGPEEPDVAGYCVEEADPEQAADDSTPGWVRRFDCPMQGDRSVRVEARADSSSIVRRLRVTAPGGEAQELPVVADDPFPVSIGFLRAVDLNGDDVRDLMLLTRYGATGNATWAVWLWDARARRFAHDPGLSEHTNLRPIAGGCWETYSTGGHAGRIYGRERLCRVNGRVTAIRGETQDWDYDANFYLRTTRELRGDSLAVVRVDTIPDDQ